VQGLEVSGTAHAEEEGEEEEDECKEEESGDDVSDPGTCTPEEEEAEAEAEDGEGFSGRMFRMKLGGPHGRNGTHAFSVALHAYPYVVGSVHLGRGMYMKPLVWGAPMRKALSEDPELTVFWGGWMWGRADVQGQILRGLWRVCEAERPLAWAHHAGGEAMAQWHVAMWAATNHEGDDGELQEVEMSAADARAVGRMWCYPFQGHS